MHTTVEPLTALSGQLGGSWPAPAFHLESSRLLVPCAFPESGTRPAPSPVSANLAKCSFLPLTQCLSPPCLSASLCVSVGQSFPVQFFFSSSTVPAQRRRLTWTCVLLATAWFFALHLTCRLSFLFSLSPLPVCPRSLFLHFHPSFYDQGHLIFAL